MSRSMRADLLLSLALLASGRLSGQSRGKAGVPRNWFDAPQTMCRALDALGFIAGSWAPAAEDSPVYRCTYPPGSRPEDEQARAELARANQQQPRKVTFDVTFEVTGLHRSMVDALTLTIAIGNPAEKAEAKKQLLVCIQAVYQTIGRPVPPALPAYIEKEEHFLAHEPYGVVSLFTTPQAIWFRMGRNP